MNKQDIINLRNRVSFGISPALATPLSGYEVKTDVAVELATWLIEKGSKGLFIGGTTGEGITLDHEQRKRLHAAATPACNAAGGVSMVHAGTNNLRDTLDLATHAVENGADIVAILPGFFYGLGDDAIFDYVSAVATAIPQTGVMVYDIPHMAVNGVSPSLLTKMIGEIPNFVGVKSSQGSAVGVRALVESLDDARFILTGNEKMASGLQTLGAAGMITGLSTAIPEPFIAIGEGTKNGDLAAVRKAQNQINRILDLTPPGKRIAFLKKLVSERGFDVGDPLPPRPSTDQTFWAKASAILAE